MIESLTFHGHRVLLLQSGAAVSGRILPFESRGGRTYCGENALLKFYPLIIYAVFQCEIFPPFKKLSVMKALDLNMRNPIIILLQDGQSVALWMVWN